VDGWHVFIQTYKLEVFNLHEPGRSDDVFDSRRGLGSFLCTMSRPALGTGYWELFPWGSGG
jgi:hypothetical protein